MRALYFDLLKRAHKLKDIAKNSKAKPATDSEDDQSEASEISETSGADTDGLSIL